MSVENFVIAALVDEGSAKRAFQAGITESDFEIADEEFHWIVEQYERKKPVTKRLFKKKFPEFEFIESNDKLSDLLDELKQEKAFVTISSAIDEILGGDEPLDSDNALDKAIELREVLSSVLRAHSMSSETLITSDWHGHLNHMKQLQSMRQNGEIPGIPTGLPHLDLHWGGLQGEATYVVLGRPGDAKSFFMGKLATEAAWNGYRVGFFSPEMSEHQHRCRFSTLLSSKTEIQQALNLKGAFRNRALKDGHGYNLKTYKRFLEYIDEEMKGEIALFTPKYRREKMNTAYIASRVEDLGIDVVIVDPLYKLKGSRRIRDRWERLAEITDELTDMAHAFNVPVVMSNQATRSLVGTRGEPPSKDTSFGSDAPAQEGDCVIGVKHFSEERIMKLACTKNRHGEAFKFTVAFWPNLGRMEDVTPLKGEYLNGYDAEKVDELRKALREAEEVEEDVNA
jgi:replicative DNA helicase